MSTASAQAAPCSGGLVTTRSQAATRADNIIEATVTLVMLKSESVKEIEVVLEQPSAVREREPAGRLRNAMTMRFDSCFGQDPKMFLGRGAAGIDGKRIRFYGPAYQSGEPRRFFYAESANTPMAATGK